MPVDVAKALSLRLSQCRTNLVSTSCTICSPLGPPGGHGSGAFQMQRPFSNHLRSVKCLACFALWRTQRCLTVGMVHTSRSSIFTPEAKDLMEWGWGKRGKENCRAENWMFNDNPWRSLRPVFKTWRDRSSWMSTIEASGKKHATYKTEPSPKFFF